jgi:hypothetical protein
MATDRSPTLDMINGLGYPTTPEIIYGFGFSFGYKNFDISTFFQGSARSSFFIDPNAISPFAFNSDDASLAAWFA